MGGLVEAHAGARLGAHDPGASRTGRPARHPQGHGRADRLHDRSVRGSEKSLRRRQVFRSGDQGSQATEICDAARLRAEHRMERAPLVWLLGPRHLIVANAFDGPAATPGRFYFGRMTMKALRWHSATSLPSCLKALWWNSTIPAP